MFSSLSDKLSKALSKFKNKGKLTEADIKEGMREIKLALLEADVSFKVTKEFVKQVSERAVGADVMESLVPSQQIVKIVNEELIKLMGTTQAKLEIASKPPTVIMMCGLQGAGKTTHSAKLAGLYKKQGKKTLLVACDIYRPAAIKQLQIVSQKANAGFFEQGQQNPAKTAKQAIDFANKNGFDTVIIDTAGRLHINEELMDELKQVKSAVDVDEILLTVDSMTGQDAVTVAEAFDKALDITGVIMTKLDGDTRGGATLSIKAVTGKPIKFCGTGEKLEDIEVFHPDRMASRILGMGDVLSLIDKAQEAITQEDAAKLAKKLKDQSFDLNDYLAQFESIQKMGNIKDLVGMLPGMGKLKISEKDIDEKEILRFKAIIQSMTPKERSEPKILNYTRKKRIAAGSGTSVQDVNKLVKNFEQTKEMMKRFGKGKKGMRLPF